MPQFAVHRNPNPGTNALFPLLVDIQSDLLEELQTRVVIPLCKAGTFGKRSLTHLTPVLPFEGDSYVLMTPELAGISLSDLGAPAGSLAKERDAIVAAMDFLLAGF